MLRSMCCMSHAHVCGQLREHSPNHPRTAELTERLLLAGADPKLVRSGYLVGGETQRPGGGHERRGQNSAGVFGAGPASRNALAAGDELFRHDRLRYHAGRHPRGHSNATATRGKGQFIIWFEQCDGSLVWGAVPDIRNLITSGSQRCLLRNHLLRFDVRNPPQEGPRTSVADVRMNITPKISPWVFFVHLYQVLYPHPNSSPESAL